MQQGCLRRFKPSRTITRNFLVAPKDKHDKDRLCGVVYKVKCKDCDALHTCSGDSQTVRYSTRIKEHRKALRTASAISEHSIKKGHGVEWDSVEVIDQGTTDFPRNVREALHIYRRVRRQMNRDGGWRYLIYQADEHLWTHTKPVSPSTPNLVTHHWPKKHRLSGHLSMLRLYWLDWLHAYKLYNDSLAI